ncbi:Pyridoxamine kinase [Hartmannibacter diazotrophicus]|uniref:pyridoxal kinase n=1 Tax=Hartmannibacter diazotrophicus TaxID=1482074 RepID=A0A2C9DBA2_9HYPH|nr:pyridoxal kinase [Hartmannibacter diazotrophicus]SON57513.1 Pyridoxamine kinase [Hartmannibacter diazotrophicus]
MTDQSPPPSEIIVISSQVARGSVGGRADFVFERLGHRVWFVPTVLLPWHPGHGLATRIEPSPDDFAAMLADLGRAPWLPNVGAIVSGYLGSGSQAAPIAGLVRALKAVNPSALFLCDPVIGDEGGLYVPEATGQAVRDELLPLADLVTPNITELGWLSGRSVSSVTEVVQVARALGPARVAVTSVPAMLRGKIATLLVDGGESASDQVLVAENNRLPPPEGSHVFSGTGDVFAALLLDKLLAKVPAETALRHAVAGTYEVLIRSAHTGEDELDLVGSQDRFVHPMAMVDVRRLAVPRETEEIR